MPQSQHGMLMLMLQLVSLVLVFVGLVLMQVVFVLVHDVLLVMIQSGMVQSSLILPVCKDRASIFWRSALRVPRVARGGSLWASSCTVLLPSARSASPWAIAGEEGWLMLTRMTRMLQMVVVHVRVLVLH